MCVYETGKNLIDLPNKREWEEKNQAQEGTFKANYLVFRKKQNVRKVASFIIL
jgi:hypothetical protein